MAASGRVLIVEDDADLAELVAFHLQDIGLDADRVADGRTGLEKACTGAYGLVILDLMLPGLDGLEVCRRIRERCAGTPILVLTARSEEVDKVLGLELGADDYVTKPFSVRELQARVKAVMRRAEPRADDRPRRFGELTVDLERRKVVLGERVVELTAREFDLLALLVRHPGRAFSRSELLERVWGYRYEGYDHTISSHVNRLRGKIEAQPDRPRLLKTVWGVGYRFAEPGELEP